MFYYQQVFIYRSQVKFEKNECIFKIVGPIIAPTSGE